MPGRKAEGWRVATALLAASVNKTSSEPDALDAFRPAGSVVELACGPGTWTPQLLRHASDVTAVEASPEMLAIAASRVPGGAR